MRGIKCINIVAMYKSAMCTFFILSRGGLGSFSPGFAAYFFYETVEILQLFQKRYMIRATGTGPRLIKLRKGNTWSEEDNLDFRGELFSCLERLFFPKQGR
jgi:hypothetical protein